MERDISEVMKVFERKNNKLNILINSLLLEDKDVDLLIEGVSEIATTLRILLDNTKGNSIVNQLKLMNKPFFPGVQGGLGANLVKESKLVNQRIGMYNSVFVTPDKIRSSFYTTFLDWWQDKVIDLKNGIRVSRGRIVKTIANKEGGTHLDKEYDEFYRIICGASILTPNNVDDFKMNIYFVSLLSITKEYLRFVELIGKYGNISPFKTSLETDKFFVVSKCKCQNYEVNNYRLFKITDLMATQIYLGVEWYNDCKYYISIPKLHAYREKNATKHPQFRMYDSKNDKELLYIVDISRFINAFGIKEKKKIIIYEGSQIYLSLREQCLRHEREGLIETRENYYLLKSDMNFSTITQAKRYILGESEYNLNWGSLITRI